MKLRSIRSVLFLCLHGRKSQQKRIAASCQEIMEEDKEVVLAVSHEAASCLGNGLFNILRVYSHLKKLHYGSMVEHLL
ncbi:hypothetical protein SFC02_04095 [Terribacillus goriensis]|uniref:hypothetical protein n=1 Tax=Terribacillus saccharophilus TaxID=361277 RepID=UPI003983848C